MCTPLIEIDFGLMSQSLLRREALQICRGSGGVPSLMPRLRRSWSFACVPLSARPSLNELRISPRGEARCSMPGRSHAPIGPDD